MKHNFTNWSGFDNGYISSDSSEQPIPLEKRISAPFKDTLELIGENRFKKKFNKVVSTGLMLSMLYLGTASLNASTANESSLESSTGYFEKVDPDNGVKKKHKFPVWIVPVAVAVGAGIYFLTKKKAPTPPVEKVDNIQNFTATSSDGGNVTGTHAYSINGASGALGTPVNAGTTTKGNPVASNITVSGDNIISRLYDGVTGIIGTQSRTDKLSSNTRYDAWNWINEMLGKNETYKYPSIELKFYSYKGWVIPQNFRDGIKAQFDTFVKDNPYVKTVTVTDGGVYPGTYVAKDGVIAIVPTDTTSSISNDLDVSLKSGTMAINPDFDSITFASVPGECKDLAGGPKNNRGAALQWNTVKMGSSAYAENRTDFEVRNVNGVPQEYQKGFSGITNTASINYSNMQSNSGFAQGSSVRSLDNVIRKQNQAQNNYNPELSYKKQIREKQ